MKIFTTLLLLILFSSKWSYSQVIFSPRNLTGEFDENSRQIRLDWDEADSSSAGYNLFVKRGMQAKFLLWGKAGLIGGTKYDFEVTNRLGEFYEFKVTTVINFPEVIRSDYSNTVIVEASSEYLPMVRLNEPKTKKNQTKLTWEYKATPTDLNGFILYLDNEEILVSASSRSYTQSNLSSGKHFVQITAVTSSGVKSAPTSKKLFIIK